MSKFSERANELASKAAEAAGPALSKSRVKAEELAAKAAEKSQPYVEKAAAATSQGVGKAAGEIDKRTNGKYTDRIGSVSSTIQRTLDRDKPAG